ncbi:glycosyltransferase family 87 protein [Sphaerobacter thermophilus]|uniref:glycosyltransferase family 87 protein n=1 Tax=Sphaerobacter thermophilus TaxID=2057 RepID=UPI0039C4DEFA
MDRTGGAHTAIVAGCALLLVVQFIMALGSQLVDGLFGHVGMDFLTTYTAAQIIADGDGHRLYDWWAQRLAQYPIIAAQGVSWSDRILQPYVAPPVLAVLALPLQWLPAPGAFAVWVALSAGAFFIAARLLDRALNLRLGWLLPLVTFSFFPVFYTLRLGQAEGLLFLGVVAYVVLSRRGKDLPAGLALGILAIKPPLLVVPAIYLATKQRWRALIGLTIACAVAAGLSLAILGSAGVADYLELSHDLSQPAGTIATNVTGMINVRGTVVRLLPSAPALVQEVAIVGISLTLLGVTVAVWRRSTPERGTPADEAETALMLVATCLLSYHTLIHTGSLLLPAIALLWRAIHREPTSGVWDRGVMGWMLAALWVAPTVAFLPTGTSQLPAIVLTPFVALLWIFSAEYVIRHTTPEPALAKVQAARESRRW